MNNGFTQPAVVNANGRLAGARGFKRRHTKILVNGNIYRSDAVAHESDKLLIADKTLNFYISKIMGQSLNFFQLRPAGGDDKFFIRHFPERPRNVANAFEVNQAREG